MRARHKPQLSNSSPPPPLPAGPVDAGGTPLPATQRPSLLVPLCARPRRCQASQAGRWGEAQGRARRRRGRGGIDLRVEGALVDGVRAAAHAPRRSVSSHPDVASPIPRPSALSLLASAHSPLLTAARPCMPPLKGIKLTRTIRTRLLGARGSSSARPSRAKRRQRPTQSRHRPMSPQQPMTPPSPPPSPRFPVKTDTCTSRPRRLRRRCRLPLRLPKRRPRSRGWSHRPQPTQPRGRSVRPTPRQVAPRMRSAWRR